MRYAGEGATFALAYTRRRARSCSRRRRRRRRRRAGPAEAVRALLPRRPRALVPGHRARPRDRQARGHAARGRRGPPPARRRPRDPLPFPPSVVVSERAPAGARVGRPRRTSVDDRRQRQGPRDLDAAVARGELVGGERRVTGAEVHAARRDRGDAAARARRVVRDLRSRLRAVVGHPLRDQREGEQTAYLVTGDSASSASSPTPRARPTRSARWAAPAKSRRPRRAFSARAPRGSRSTPPRRASPRARERRRRASRRERRRPTRRGRAASRAAR